MTILTQSKFIDYLVGLGLPSKYKDRVKQVAVDTTGLVDITLSVQPGEGALATHLVQLWMPFNDHTFTPTCTELLEVRTASFVVHIPAEDL